MPNIFSQDRKERWRGKYIVGERRHVCAEEYVHSSNFMRSVSFLMENTDTSGKLGDRDYPLEL